MIALASLGAILWNDEYRPGVYGVLAVYLVAMTYFGIAGRHKLVFSPEEEFAMTHGEAGTPKRKATATPAWRAGSTRTANRSAGAPMREEEPPPGRAAGPGLAERDGR